MKMEFVACLFDQ